MGKLETLAATPIGIVQSSITINATAVVYSNTWVLTRHRDYSLEVQFSSDTDVDVKIELEQGNVLPSVQKSYSSNFVSPIETVSTIMDEDVHIIPVVPVVSIYARLKLTGLSGNSVTTALERVNWVEVEN